MARILSGKRGGISEEHGIGKDRNMGKEARALLEKGLISSDQKKKKRHVEVKNNNNNF